jgi:hypothetical protein
MAVLCLFANSLSAQTTTNKDDLVSLIFNNSVNVDVLTNHAFTNCKQVSIGIVTKPTKGTLVVNADNTLTYTPDKDIFGIDKAKYSIKCGSDTKEIVIYFAVLKPMSMTNVACIGTKIFIDMITIPGLSYAVYTVPTGGGIVNLPVTKDASAVQTWYFEAQWPDQNKIFPRVPISVFRSDNCGNETTSGCAVDGQLLFREDFGGNNVSDPRISTTSLPKNVTNCDFQSTDKLTKNQYTIVKHIIADEKYAWQKNFSDHTNPNDKNRGYMFLVDASETASQFYETQITGLCNNINKLYFSAWVANVIPTSNKTANDNPILKFELLDDNNKIVGMYVTSEIPKDAEGKLQWRNYGFTFDPKGYESLKLRIYNNRSGSNGNDFVMDDIEIRLCVPPVSLTKSTDTLCFGSPYTINGSYTDDGTYTSAGNTLVYRWQHSDVNTPQATWTTVKEGTAVNSTSLNTALKIDYVDAENQGYYRLVVANSATIDRVNCRAVSQPVYLHVKTMKANDDVAMAVYNHSTDIDVLKNDSLSNCTDVTKLKIDTVAGSGLRNGSLIINPDNTFTYTPKNNVSGIDSVDYSVEYSSTVEKARLYIVISKPLSLYNVACAGTKISVGMHSVPDVTYRWYDVPTGGNVLYTTAQISVTKDNSDVQTWFVETIYKNKVSGRFAISVLKSDNCGSENPAGCVVDGQLLFSEDFGGNSVSDKTVSIAALPSNVTDYAFMTTENLTSNSYALVKYISSKSGWQKNFSDHTNPDDKNSGYMFLVNASNDTKKFYETRITGLCDNINKLYFSAWVANVLPSNSSAKDNPVLRFDLKDDSDNIVGTYVTSSVPRDANGNVKWRNYGFAFDPRGYSSLKLVISNNATGGDGNDFALDDIEIRMCVPPITIAGNLIDTACTETSASFKASYDDLNGTFTASGKKLVYRWEYSSDGVNWSIHKEDSTAAASVQSVYTIDRVTEMDEGYYRFIAGNHGTVDNHLCSVISKVISLRVLKSNKASDFRAMIMPSTAQHTVYLSSFIDTVNVKSVKWDSFGNTLKFDDDETGALNAQSFMPKRIYTYKYTVTSQCGSSSAKAYVFTSIDKVRRNGREIFVCKDLEASMSVNLNQILGVEGNGAWSFPDDMYGIIISNITTSSVKFGSSMIFNAQRAYEEGSQTDGYEVAGNPEQQAFKFRYTTVNGMIFDFTIVTGK